MNISSNEGQPEWIFGYGSLMWDPGFSYEKKRTATLKGYHRAFCIYSHHYRGTPEQPGLVLGLDRGGECRGIAFRITTKTWQEIVSYLGVRELIGYAYKSKRLFITFNDGAHVVAHTYTADQYHPYCAGTLTIAETVNLIMYAKASCLTA